MGFWRDVDPRELMRMLAWSKTYGKRFWRGWHWEEGHICDDKTVKPERDCGVCY